MKIILFMLILPAALILLTDHSVLSASGKTSEVTDSTKICPVSKEEISGEGVKYKYLNQEFEFCNDGCEKAFKKNPAKYSSSGLYDVVCDMDDGNKNISASADGVKYYFCNEGCKEKFAKNPDKYLSKYKSENDEQ